MTFQIARVGDTRQAPPGRRGVSAPPIYVRGPQLVSRTWAGLAGGAAGGAGYVGADAEAAAAAARPATSPAAHARPVYISGPLSATPARASAPAPPTRSLPIGSVFLAAMLPLISLLALLFALAAALLLGYQHHQQTHPQTQDGSAGPAGSPARPTAKTASSGEFLHAITDRRTIYALSDKPILPNDQLVKCVL